MNIKNNKDQVEGIEVPKPKSKIGRGLYPFTLIGLFLLTIAFWVVKSCAL